MRNETMQKIAAKVLLQMEMEKLMNTEVGKLLDINPVYLSMIKRPEQYDKCPMKAWRKMHVWYHSGSNLRDYDHTKAPEVRDIHPSEEATETIPEVKRTGVPKREPVAVKGKPPTEQKPSAPKEEEPTAPPPPPLPEQTHAGDAMTIKAQTRKIVIEPKPKGKPGRKPKDKGEGSPYGKYEKPAPSQEEIERVLATLGIEIEVVVKLKNKKD